MTWLHKFTKTLCLRKLNCFDLNKFSTVFWNRFSVQKVPPQSKRFVATGLGRIDQLSSRSWFIRNSFCMQSYVDIEEDNIFTTDKHRALSTKPFRTGPINVHLVIDCVLRISNYHSLVSPLQAFITRSRHTTFPESNYPHLICIPNVKRKLH